MIFLNTICISSCTLSIIYICSKTLIFTHDNVKSSTNIGIILHNLIPIHKNKTRHKNSDTYAMAIVT